MVCYPFVALALNLAEAITVWPSDNILCSKFISSSLPLFFLLFVHKPRAKGIVFMRRDERNPMLRESNGSREIKRK